MRRRVFRPSAIGNHHDDLSLSICQSPSYGRFTTQRPDLRRRESSASEIFPSRGCMDEWGQLSLSGAICSIVETSGSH
jgi:hypothetical protein